MTATLAPKYDPTRRCRPPSLWPAADRLAWDAALQPGDVLDPGGPASRWAPLTRSGAARAYGRWLTWLDGTGQLEPGASFADQVTPERVRDFVGALQPVNAPMTVLHRIESLARAAGALAPDRNWAWLWAEAGWLQRTAVSVRLKHPRLVGADELFAFGCELMAEAEDRPEGSRAGAPWRRAVGYRDGLMVALLAARPLRLKNFAAIEIGRHLVVHGTGYRLQVPRAEMKGRRPLRQHGAELVEQPVPEALTPYLERYLVHHRPRLCERGAPQVAYASVDDEPCRALWVGQSGVALSPVTLYARIVELTEKRFGQSVNPHLFRDCAATSIATMDPEHVRITMTVLGHTKLATSERYYNHARSFEAARLHQANIMALRRRV